MATSGSSTAEPVEHLVVASEVTRRFHGAGGVRDMNLRVPRGRIVGLVGPSGSGKTTAVRLLLGIDRPDRGRIAVLDQEPTSFTRSHQRRIGYLPQHGALYSELSLRHNLQLMASLYGMPWRARFLPGSRARDARARVQHLIELLDLGDVQRTRLGDASGGEQRRLALAAAMVHEPDLLVLDEPTTGIDPVLRRRLWEHFAALRDEGTTLLITTQYVTEAVHCDLIAMLVDGRVMAFGDPDDLRRQAFGDQAPEEATFDDVFVRLVEDHRASLVDHRADEPGEVA